jgi:hypothetical protein
MHSRKEDERERRGEWNSQKQESDFIYKRSNKLAMGIAVEIERSTKREESGFALYRKEGRAVHNNPLILIWWINFIL